MNYHDLSFYCGLFLIRVLYWRSQFSPLYSFLSAGSLIFINQFFFFIINFQNEKANPYTLIIILIVKSLQIELHSTNLLPWPPICRNIINVQSLQSTTTPRTLTISFCLDLDLFQLSQAILTWVDFVICN